ncbi:C40 family peptidase [Pantoea stewartii]|uniref:C40 family peptidase n=1 Tax=Pantoea stewartii TaxID=66269 RepID=UPI00197DEF02|nr:C40 family peptidase [Pantoea stewartii]
MAHAETCKPQECCGLVISSNQHCRYIPCTNFAASPCQNFIISSEDFLNATTNGEILALVHSHPEGPCSLSEADRTMQKLSNYDWWLVCEDTIHCFGIEDDE